jgi:hypothetical protein
MKVWFRALAASFSEPAPAQAIAGVILLALNMYTGYSIPKSAMIKPLSWITYVNVRVPDIALHPTTDSDLAPSVRIRVDLDERVQDLELDLFDARSPGSRLREHHNRESGVCDTRRCTRSELGRRKRVCRSFFPVQVEQHVDGELFFRNPTHPIIVLIIL